MSEPHPQPPRSIRQQLARAAQRLMDGLTKQPRSRNTTRRGCGCPGNKLSRAAARGRLGVKSRGY